MLQNNTVYKGYRLNAKIARPPAVANGSPMFAATILVGIASSPEAGESYEVPRFAEGGFVVSPGEAVHAAILFGRTVVDGLPARPSKPAQD
ncbi:hypothetical protein [Bordetella genomosp. 11]|uniref:Uncharacterized protein n=1 Tax=Bordetella genomosp. 11 TaxID=1416808 RepID=A0A261UFU9_9BORD|nr:hypothetical protein [Bordetella genomosp. 11]OZI60809.1 hypothetical protein CAL28_15640 [Bordetella genomosp. 11]